ncbi:MAG: septal ring lytic transglycosylase RlpA family protein [Pseudomonadota bacterium]
MAYAKRVGPQYAACALKLAAASAVGLASAAFATGEAAAKPRQPAPIVYAKASPNTPVAPTIVYQAPGPQGGGRVDAWSQGQSQLQRAQRPAQSQSRQIAHAQPRLNDFGRDPAIASGAFDAAPAAVSVHRAPPASYQPQRRLTSAPVRKAPVHDPNSGFAKQKIGAPYQVAGKWYVPTPEPNYDEVGIASWYGPKFHGRPTANGETFDMNAMTAAHPTLPIPSLVRVTNLENGRTVVLRLNDRGPFVDDRMIDLSRKASQVLGFEAAGTAKVRVQYMGLAPKEPNSLPPEYANQAQMFGAPSVRRQIVNAPRPPKQPAPQAYGEHYVQAGAFADLGNAHALRREIESFGSTVIGETRVNGSDFFRVLLGPLPDRRAADAARERLVYAGYKGVVVQGR